MRTIFKGGKVVDGSGAPSYVADILVENGVIAGIGSFEGEPGTQVYDARERIVCPGFIDTHIHLPEGAVPKDGPSAGITMATALASAYTGRKVRGDTAMTGEITLTGEVLPIGGLKEKLLAAVRGGLAKVLIPEENVRDLAEIPDNIKNKLEIVPVKWIDQVLELALERVPQALPEDAAATAQANEKSENPPAQSVVTH